MSDDTLLFGVIGFVLGTLVGLLAAAYFINREIRW